MKVDLRSLILGAALVLMGYFMGMFGTGVLIAESLPNTLEVELRTPGFLDVKIY